MKIQNKIPCRVKMIFSDIDGTLLDSCHQITDRTCKKIMELEQKGIPFVLVSARMPEGVTSIQRKIGNHSPIICKIQLCNGECTGRGKRERSLCDS